MVLSFDLGYIGLWNVMNGMETAAPYSLVFLSKVHDTCVKDMVWAFLSEYAILSVGNDGKVFFLDISNPWSPRLCSRSSAWLTSIYFKDVSHIFVTDTDRASCKMVDINKDSRVTVVTSHEAPIWVSFHNLVDMLFSICRMDCYCRLGWSAFNFRSKSILSKVTNSRANLPTLFR